MGLFSKLLGLNDDPFESLNPLHGTRLKSFVIADGVSDYLAHYFSFSGKEQDMDFTVVYNRLSRGEMRYAFCLQRYPNKEREFSRLNDRSPWWPAVSRLIDMGQELSTTVTPVQWHYCLEGVNAELRRVASNATPKPSDNTNKKSSDLHDDVEKNPDSYAIWMVRPGDQYEVYLVKLNAGGELEEGWKMGDSFSDRSAQGAYALDLARGLKIKLMDVVRD